MKRKSDEGFFTILGLIVLSLMLSFAQLLTQRAAALHKLAGAQERIDMYITALDMVHAQLQKEQETEEEAAHQTLHDVHGLRIEWDEGEAKVWSAGEMIMRVDYEGQEITDVRYGA